MKNLVPKEAPPMQAEQYLAFLDGDKELCVLEKRKDANTFGKALHDYVRDSERSTYHLHLWRSPEGIEVVLGEQGIITEYLHVLHNDVMWMSFPDAGREHLGKMFGYLPGEIRTFVANWTPEYCMCSKCVGVKRAKDYNLRREQREAAAI